MHELSLLVELIEQATALAKVRGARSIDRVRLEVGELSGVVPEALTFAFPIAAQGTIAAGAKLDMAVVPVVACCRACDREFTPTDIVYACPTCGQISDDIRCGTELTFHSMEITTDE